MRDSRRSSSRSQPSISEQMRCCHRTGHGDSERRAKDIQMVYQRRHVAESAIVDRLNQREQR